MSWNATVDRLRGQAQQYGLASDYVTAKVLYEAVDEIERIARERDKARAGVAVLHHEVERYQQREAHFAKALGVTDDGQYRADWDSAIEKVLRERDEARAQADGLAKAHHKATLGLMAATSAYREFAKGRDALYGTRVKDFERATEAARAALAAMPKEEA